MKVSDVFDKFTSCTVTYVTIIIKYLLVSIQSGVILLSLISFKITTNIETSLSIK